MEAWDAVEAGEVAELAWPTRIVLGAGALERLPEELRRLGLQRPLVVTDPGVVRAGLAARVGEVLQVAGIASLLFEGVQPNPTEEDVEHGLRAFREARCDGVIALGGGSAMDAGKLIQLTSTHAGPLEQYDDALNGGDRITGPLPALVAIPTTAGTGSEVGRSAVVTLRGGRRKTVIFSPLLLPRVALCDPELTLGLPKRTTAETGMDALTHCVEAFVARGFHPLADAVALDGMRRIARSLPVVIERGESLFARTDMMIAAMEGAMAFQKGLGAAHALAHALTPMAGLSHGLANALVLPAVIDWNLPMATGRYARVAEALSPPAATGGAFDPALASVRVRELALRVGIPQGLGAAGVDASALEQIGARAFEDATHRGNPRPCDAGALTALLRAAY